jgi:sterol desaturase/sphingolipid hydroxylase (fatty acid hydroxylase superfamily)
MGGREQIYQAITLILIVLFVDFLERRRPGQVVDRRNRITLNILALLITASAGEMWKEFLQGGLNVLDLDRIFAPTAIRRLPGAVKILLGLTLADFCLYWVHRYMHRPTLWPTHKFHHSIDELWWLAGSRTSLTHLFLFAVPQVFLAYYIFALSPREAGIAFAVGVVVNVWIHANLWVSLGSLEWLLITPNYHRVHHGAKGLSSRNLGFILTVWDRMFGTYINPETTGKDFALGFVSTRHLFRMIVGL